MSTDVMPSVSATSRTAVTEQGSRLSAVREALPLLLRRRGALADLLPVIAFAVSTAITLTVLGGLGAFIGRLPDSGAALDELSAEQSVAGFLVMCAVVATVLLVPSAVGLGGSAARLSLARREKDLASLRLVGGTSAQVGSVAVLDVVVQCLLGSVIGLVAHLLLALPLTGLDFGITAFTVAELLLPWWSYPLLIGGLVLLAAISAGIALSGVVLSPLGVARDARVVRMSVLRLVLLAVLAIAFVALSQVGSLFASEEGGAMMVMAFMIVLLGAMVAAVNVAGPFLVWITAKIVARLARSAAVLVGARRLAADPRAGWRAVAGVTFAMIIAGFLSVLATLNEPSSAEDVMLITALRTGGMLTLVIAAVLAAVATGVPQTARVIDQAPVLRAQYVAGAQVPQLHRARLVEIVIPLLMSSVLAFGMVALVLASVMSTALSQPGVLIQYVLGIVAAYAMVLGSILVAAPLVRRGALQG